VHDPQQVASKGVNGTSNSNSPMAPPPVNSTTASKDVSPRTADNSPRRVYIRPNRRDNDTGTRVPNLVIMEHKLHSLDEGASNVDEGGAAAGAPFGVSVSPAQARVNAVAPPAAARGQHLAVGDEDDESNSTGVAVSVPSNILAIPRPSHRRARSNPDPNMNKRPESRGTGSPNPSVPIILGAKV